MIAMIVVSVLILFLIFYYSRPKNIQIPMQFKWESPPDWSLDWDGGHGKSRYDIMMEPGPYFDPNNTQMIPDTPNM